MHNMPTIDETQNLKQQYFFPPIRVAAILDRSDLEKPPM